MMRSIGACGEAERGKNKQKLRWMDNDDQELEVLGD
jgi:hypothetical protein